jgi:NTE family protein
MAREPRIGLALAGGGPFGAIYEIGALMALEEALEGLDFRKLDVYVGVSAGSFLAAALANGIAVPEIHRLFIRDQRVEGALTPEVFMRPAFREYLRRARRLPPLLARAFWQSVSHPLEGNAREAFSGLGRAIPTGLFDNEAIHDYLASVFSEPGHTNDFRRLGRKLFLVATDLDSGESVSFGRAGHDHVPISRAVQASSALPGLFPPVEIDGRHYVDGALRKTLHASEALAEGAKLVICINPIVPWGGGSALEPRERLAEGGLPLVLSQTFRALIHSRMAAGLSRYRSQFPGSDVVLFQPDRHDHEMFHTNIFSYAMRQRICEAAYQGTRRDLLRRHRTLAPRLARHGIAIRLDVLRDTTRGLSIGLAPPPRLWPGGSRLPAAARDLEETLARLRRWMAR